MTPQMFSVYWPIIYRFNWRLHMVKKICFVKYHVSEDRSSIVESSGGVQTLRNVSSYHEPACHFDGKFVNGQGHVRTNVQNAPGHGHFLETKNSAYHCPYDLVENKVNAIYIVYKTRQYDSTGSEHNYLFSCGMDDNHRSICFLKNEKTMRVYGVAAKPNYMDISNFPTRYYNPCRKDKWNVVCVVYDIMSGKSSLWVNHGKICDFVCRLPLKASTLNLFYKVVHFDDVSGFDGYIESVEMYNYYRSIPSGLIADRMIYLCEKYKIPKRADGSTIMNRSNSVEFFRIEMASRTDTALDQLNHVINDTFFSIRKFEPFDRYNTLQSMYTALGRQLQDGLMDQQKSYCMRFIVRKLWDLKL